MTNLSAMDNSTRQRIYKEGAISTIEGLMFEEHDLIRRAATELMCNMIQLQDVHERFYSDNVESQATNSSRMRRTRDWSSLLLVHWPSCLMTPKSVRRSCRSNQARRFLRRCWSGTMMM